MADRFLLQSGGGVIDLQSGGGDLLLQSNGGGASPALDDGDSWGFVNVVSGIAKGLAVAALSLNVAIAGTFKQQDDLPVTSTPAVSSPDANGPRRAEPRPVVIKWFQGDELPSVAATFVDDDPGWTPPKGLQPPQLILPTWDNETIIPVEDEVYPWTPPVVSKVSITPLVWSDSDEVPTQPTPPALDEGEFWVGISLPVKQSFYLPSPEEELSWEIEETYEWVPRWSLNGAKPQVFSDTDEIVTAPVNFYPDEDYWVAPFSVEVKPLFSAFLDTDNWVPPYIHSEDEWTVVTPPPAKPFVKVFSAEDERPTPVTFTPVEEDWVTLRAYPGTINYIVWVGDEEIVPQPTPQVGAGSVLRETVNILRWHQGDDLPQQSVSVGLFDQDYWPQPFLPKTTLQPFSYDDIIGSETVVGTSNTTNNNDTSNASGTTTIVGTGSSTNNNDTSTASGTTTIVGTSTTTNNDDTSSATGTTAVVGTGNSTNNDDTSSASGTQTILGSSSTTNNNDTSSAFGTSGNAPTILHQLPMTGAGTT